MSPPRAPFIVFEGPEGAGKSGQIARAAEWLEAAGHGVVRTREPGGTPIGERIRDQVLGALVEVPPIAELLLFTADRAAHVDLVIRPALARGEAVLCDRFALSTRIYQGIARGIDPDVVDAVTALATGGLEPDLYVILDVPPEIGAGRQRAAGQTPDRIEREDTGFMRRVREGYLEFARAAENAALVDADESPEAVALGIRGVIETRFAGWIAGRG